MQPPTDTDKTDHPSPTPGADPAGHRSPLPRGTDLLLLLAIFALAFTLRLVYDLQAQANPLFDHPCLDARIHDEWARSIVEGQSMFPAPFFRGPLYPWFLAGIYKLAGPDYLLPRLVLAAIGSLSCCLIFLIGRDAFNRPTGVIAGLAAATYWVLIYFDGELLLETNSVFLNLLATWFLIRAQARPHWALWLAAGLAFGLSAINRPNVLAYLPFVALWIAWLNRRALAAALRRALLFAAGCAVPILPITAYNYFAGHDLILIAWQGGINFLIGNNPKSDGVTAQLEGIPATWLGTYNDSVTLAERATGRKLKPSEVDDYFYDQAWQFFRQQPAEAAALLLAKLRYFFHAKELPNPTDLYFSTRRYTPIVAYLPLTFGLVAPLSLLGLWFARKRLAAQFPLWGFGLIYALTVIAYFVTSRFRLPVVPVLIIYAAFAVVQLWAALRSRDWPTLGGSAAALLAAWLLTHMHMPDHYFAAAPSYCAVGEAFHRAGQNEKALAEYDNALTVTPDYAKAHVAKGMIHWESQQWPQAIDSLEKGLRLDPKLAVYAHLAEAFTGAGRFSDAIATLRQGIQIHPQDASLYRGLAWLLAVSPNASDRNGPEALQIAQRIAAAFPNDPIAQDTLAAAHAEMGQFLEAMQHAQKAIDLAEAQGAKELAQEVRQRLIEYENRKPHRHE